MVLAGDKVCGLMGLWYKYHLRATVAKRMRVTHQALKDVRVVDFTTMVAGGGTSRLLADCGAAVIKIEAPEGDLMRAFGPNFGLYNVGKRSIVLDLKNPAGAAIALDLIRQADIVVENFRPGAMRQFGLDYVVAKAAKPDIIYCSITGFGQYGPFSDKAAYAPVAHAFSGFDMLVASNPDPDAPPITNTLMLADALTPAFAFGAIQTAYIHRLRCGEGAHVDVTMTESMMHMLGMQFLRAQEGATTRLDYGMSAHPPYRTLDGYINIPIASVATQRALYRVIDRQDWLDDPELRSLHGLRARRAEVNAAIAQWASTRTSAECDEAMAAAKVPSAIYHLPHEWMSHPHLQARRVFTPIETKDGVFHAINAPFQFDGEPIRPGRGVAELGGDTIAVLASDLGIEGDALTRLQAEGAFGTWAPSGDMTA